MDDRFQSIKAISFDLDDTLYDNRPVIKNAFRVLYDYLCVEYPTVKELYTFDQFLYSATQTRATHAGEYNLETLRKLHIQEILAKSSSVLNLDDPFIDIAFKQFLQARQKVKVFSETLKILETLSTKLPLVSLSNGNVDPKSIGIDHYFKFHVNAADAGRPKPDSSMFKIAYEKLEIQAFELLHVGDSIATDIRGANLAGCKSVWFSPQTSSELFSSEKGSSENGFSEKIKDDFSQPDATIESLSELLLFFNHSLIIKK